MKVSSTGTCLCKLVDVVPGPCRLWPSCLPCSCHCRAILVGNPRSVSLSLASSCNKLGQVAQLPYAVAQVARTEVAS
jgi:hypothetical protein